MGLVSKLSATFKAGASRFYMAVTTLLRLSVSLLTFALLARALGPQQFGLYATALAYSSLASLFTDFGLPLQLLRDGATNSSQRMVSLTVSLWAKTYLVVPVSLLALAATFFADITGVQRLAIIALYCGTVVGSYGDLMLVTFRAAGRFKAETYIVLRTSVVHAVLLSLASVLTQNLLVVACAFFAGRAFYTSVAWVSVKTTEQGVWPTKTTPRDVVNKLIRSVTFALDSIGTNLATQLDVLLIHGALGLTAVGIYQAGARPVQIALSLSSIPMNIHVPRLSQAQLSNDKGGRRRAMQMVSAEWLGLGLVFGLSLVVLGPIYTRIVVGPEFVAVNQLWLGFGALVFIKYASAPLGIILLIRNNIHMRVAGQVAAAAALCLLFVLFEPARGLVAVPWLSAIAGLVTIVIYALGVFLTGSKAKRHRRKKSDKYVLSVLGVRGFPDVMGGIESHCEQIMPRIARIDPKLDIVVLARSRYVRRGQHVSNGVRMLPLWSPNSKYLEAPLHTFYGVLYSRLILRADLIHIHGIGPGLMAPLARLIGLRTIVTHHGKDYNREKWGPFARWLLKVGEKAVYRFSHAVIVVGSDDLPKAPVSDAGHLQRVAHIPNGVTIVPPEERMTRGSVLQMLSDLGITREGYILSVSRLVPEKRLIDLITAFQTLPEDRQLVIVGAPDAGDRHGDVLREAAGERVVFAGRQPRQAVDAFLRSCSLFVLPSAHEGLPIAALEAIGAGAAVLLSDIPANLSIGLPPQNYFPVGQTAELAIELRRDPDWFNRYPSDVVAGFDWDAAAKRTLIMYRQLLGRGETGAVAQKERRVGVSE